MKIEKTNVDGFRPALRAMRNPLDSWDISDSCWEPLKIGKNDLKLSCRLIKAGAEHRKFLRVITITVDFTLPRYVWQELDTYKVSTVRNSCSTMHKLGHRDLTEEDFMYGKVLPETLRTLNEMGKEYRETKNYDLVRDMKCYLPEGFLQKSTYFMNYETAITMFYQRKSHKLAEWNLKDTGVYSICKWIKDLPYMDYWLEEK